MYAKPVIESRLNKAATVLGFEPTYYSDADRERNKADLVALKDPESGTLKRKLDSDEIRFVRNERALITCDLSHYHKYSTIIGWDGRKTTYKPNFAQRIMADLRAEMEEKQFSIEIINLKARRLGISTDEEIAIAHRAQCWSHTTAIVASADPEMSAKMSQIMETNWNNMPWFLMPRITRYNVGELIGFGDIGSSVSIQAGSQLKGIARGDSPNVVHLSEISYYKNPEELIDASLLRAVIPNPYTLLMFETTAAGRFGWTYDTWIQAKENWPNSRLRPVFLPWYIGTDLYPTETWLRQFPIPVGWHPHALTIKHAEQAGAYVRVNDVLRKYLGTDWKMPLAQMWWWEFNYREAKQKKTLAKFLAEIAADDESAFQSGNVSCFDVEVISAHRNNTKPPLDVYGFNGVNVAPKLRIDPSRSKNVNPNKPCIDITAQWNRMQEPIKMQLVPLLWTPAQSHLGHLLIYEHPRPDQTYGFGVDTSDGVGRDRSVANGLRKGNVYEDAEQVCLYSNSTINSLELWPLLMAIGTYYSTKDSNSILRQCRMAIEVGRGNGEATQLEMQKAGWSNFHPWHRMAAKQNWGSADSRSIGWRTMEWSRRFMLAWLIDAIDNFWLRVNAPSTVSELQTLEKDGNSQKLKACFLPTTLITKWDSGRVPISEIQVGDVVMTHMGRPGKVSAVLPSVFGGDCVQFSVTGSVRPIYCTPNHKFWVRQRPSKWMRRGDKTQKYPAGWVDSGSLKNGDWMGIPKRTSLPKCDLPQELLYAMGFWLAEGNFIFDPHGEVCGLEFTNTDDSYLHRVLAALLARWPKNEIKNNQFGKKRIIDTRFYENTYRSKESHWKPRHTLIFYHREAAELFLEYFGSGARSKRISAEFYHQSGLLPVISGFIDGDGHQRKKQASGISLSTTSTDLAWQLRQILLDNSIWNTIRLTKLDCWTMDFKSAWASGLYPCKAKYRKSIKPKRMVIEDATHFYAPIKNLKRSAFVGKVYDLTVEGDHTYTAEGVAAHNSYGAFDDEVMSLGIGLVSLHLDELLLNKSMDRRKNSTVSREFLRYKPPLSASSLPEHMLNNVRTTVDQSYESENFVGIADRLARRLGP